MELRDIEIFLTLADVRHFGRTAERLRLSQSRITRVIQALEREIGGALFDRTSRSVHLTALGEQLRDGLAPAYTSVSEAVAQTRERAANPTGRLRIGLWSLPSGGDSLLEIVRDFRRRQPGWQVELVSSGPLRQLEELRDGRIDLLVLWLPVDEPGLVIGPVLSTQQRVVRMSRQHPLAERAEVTVEDLADYAVASFPGVPESSQLSLAPARTPSGRPIPRHGEVRDQVELTQRIALGEIVHATVESVPRYSTHPDDLFALALHAVDELAGDSTATLTHGDLSLDNILAAGPGRWTAIDPLLLAGTAAHEVHTIVRSHLADVFADSDPRGLLDTWTREATRATGVDQARTHRLSLARYVASAYWEAQHGGDPADVRRLRGAAMITARLIG